MRTKKKSKKPEAAELEAELLRLNDLVRARRKQLARLAACPHKDCECRAVWHEVVEQNLATQVHKVRSHVRSKGPAKAAKRAQKARRR